MAAPNQHERAATAPDYSNLGELVLALARAGFRTLFAARYFMLAGPLRGDSRPRVAATIGSLLLTLGFSGWAARRARRRAFTGPTHALSAVADQVICFIALVPNALWPSARYQGLLQLPEIAFLSVLVFASALRLASASVIASTVAGLCALFGLVAIDGWHNAARLLYRGRDVQMQVMVIIGAGTTAWFTSWAMRGAVGKLARATSVISRGQQHLGEVLREHHDIRTTLSAARLHLDLTAEQTTGPARADLESAARAVGEVAEAVEAIRRRTLGEVLTGDVPEAVDLAAVAGGAVAVVQARFPAAAVAADVPPSAALVAVNGGQRALAHVLINLLVNGCEGDGNRGSTRVALMASADPERDGFVRIDVNDDGPGFPAAVLCLQERGGFSTKRDGGGLGLGLVDGIVGASGGTIRVENRPHGGARVSIWLPRGASGRS